MKLEIPRIFILMPTVILLGMLLIATAIYFPSHEPGLNVGIGKYQGFALGDSDSSLFQGGKFLVLNTVTGEVRTCIDLVSSLGCHEVQKTF